MKVKGGGAYFMVSRSFGIEAGAAIGIPLFLAQAVGISFYISGFAESVATLVPFLNVKLIAIVALGGIAILAYLSADIALKAQYVILAIIAASLVSFVLGSPVDASKLEPVADAAVNPLASPTFWQIFAVFFPAVTGIEAGISMSGNLSNPRRALPIGTISAVVVGYVIYLLIPIQLQNMATSDLLKQYPMIMTKIAAVPSLIFLGVWGATLSSALGALLGGPRTLQALANDRVVPAFLGKTYGKFQDPRIATIVTLMIAMVGVLLGDLDVIAPVLSMFFLTSYGALNLISGLEGLIGNPTWRPSFRVPWAISLLGAFACFSIMLMIDPGASFIAFFVVVGIYILMGYRKIKSGWSDMRGGLYSYLARSSIYRLGKYAHTDRSWRPNMIVLSGSPTSRLHLIELGDAITHGKGFLTVANVLVSDNLSAEKLINYEASIQSFLGKKNIPALVRVRGAENFVTGASALIQHYGLGPLVPNTILMGETETEDHFVGFCSIVETAFFERKNVLIARNMSSEMPLKRASERRIDVWWARKHDNAKLMLILAYMLQTSPEWAGAKLILKTMAKNQEEHRGVLKNLQDFIRESRIDVDIEVYTATADTALFAEMEVYSKDADLVFLGLAAPSGEGDTQNYSVYYKTMLDNTKKFPPTIMTLVGEKISFEEILR